MLRGCLGTFSSGQLKKLIPLFVLRSAFMDERFPSITLHEIPYLACTVSLLGNFEPAKNPLDWTVGKHGVELDFEHAGISPGFR